MSGPFSFGFSQILDLVDDQDTQKMPRRHACHIDQHLIDRASTTLDIQAVGIRFQQPVDLFEKGLAQATE